MSDHATKKNEPRASKEEMVLAFIGIAAFIVVFVWRPKFIGAAIAYAF
jgi:hypothetical protein